MRITGSLVTVACLVAILGACGGGEVTVEARIAQESASADTMSAGAAGANAADSAALAEMPVWLLPYDRDEIFDSLTAAAAEPEPQIPDSVLALRDSMTEAAAQNQQATAVWNTARDSLKTLSTEMNEASPASAEYRVMFNEFSQLENRVGTLEEEMNESFARFEQLQRRFNEQSQEIALVRAQWSDEAFAPVDSIIATRLEAAGREEYADTTGADGSVSFTVPSGEWWVHARYELPFQELYWNEPIQVDGESETVTLDRSNAEPRPKL